MNPLLALNTIIAGLSLAEISMIVEKMDLRELLRILMSVSIIEETATGTQKLKELLQEKFKNYRRYNFCQLQQLLKQEILALPLEKQRGYLFGKEGYNVFFLYKEENRREQQAATYTDMSMGQVEEACLMSA